jgi:hypothetical protein
MSRRHPIHPEEVIMRCLAVTVVLSLGFSGCSVDTRATGRTGYLCNSDDECDPGQVCRDHDGTGRCGDAPAAGPGADAGDAHPVGDDRVDAAPLPDGPLASDVNDGHPACGSDGGAASPSTCPPGTLCQDGACMDPGYVHAEMYFMIVDDGGLGFFTGYLLTHQGPFNPPGPPPDDCIPFAPTVEEWISGPLDGGELTLRLPGQELDLPFLDRIGADPPISYMSDTPISLTGAAGGTLRLEGTGNDFIGPFTTDVEVPPWRGITSPAMNDNVSSTSAWTVTWSGATQQGYVQLVVLAGAYGLNCMVADTGTFTFRDHQTDQLTGFTNIFLSDNRSTPISAAGLDAGELYATTQDQIAINLGP